MVETQRSIFEPWEWYRVTLWCAKMESLRRFAKKYGDRDLGRAADQVLGAMIRRGPSLF